MGNFLYHYKDSNSLKTNLTFSFTILMGLFLVLTMTTLISCGDENSEGSSAQSTGTHNGHEWVDLGLSVKWATCNVGATKPYEYGNYFAWGETTGYNEGDRIFSTDNYKWFSEGVGYTKYNGDAERGIVDNKFVLDAEDDAAKVNWGGNWRMPTPGEIQELVKNCYWEWTSSYRGSGVHGVIVYKAKSTTDMGLFCDGDRLTLPSASYTLNDTHIFLPAAGGIDYYTNYLNGIPNKDYPDGRFGGVYWSSAQGSDTPKGHYTITTGGGLELYFEIDCAGIGDWGRTKGASIRAVCP